MSNFLATMGENFKTLFSNPLTLIALIGCAILLIAFIKFKSLKFDSKLVARIGLAIALAFILDMLKIYTLPNGGGTLHDVTPGTLETAFSTRALQAAQLIPVT